MVLKQGNFFAAILPSLWSLPRSLPNCHPETWLLSAVHLEFLLSSWTIPTTRWLLESLMIFLLQMYISCLTGPPCHLDPLSPHASATSLLCPDLWPCHLPPPSLSQLMTLTFTPQRGRSLDKSPHISAAIPPGTRKKGPLCAVLCTPHICFLETLHHPSLPSFISTDFSLATVNHAQIFSISESPKHQNPTFPWPSHHPESSAASVCPPYQGKV